MRAWLRLLSGALVVLAFPTQAAAQAGRGKVEDGNRLYEAERYQEARESYLDALREAPDSPLIRFNEGNALYQTEDYQNALGSYRQALESADSSLLGKAWYNLGNALYRQQQLQESLQAYEEALRVDPDDVDAKHNLEFVRRKLQQQNQNRQNQQQQNDKQQNQQQQQGQQQQNDQQQDQQQQNDQRQDQQQPDANRDEADRGDRPEGADAGKPPDQNGPQGQPRQMSQEEAERLLQAIQEDPGEIQRKLMKVDRPKKVAKPW